MKPVKDSSRFHLQARKAEPQWSCCGTVADKPLQFVWCSAGKIGDYKLCYQSPSGSDSIEQKSKEGTVQIKVLETTTTSQDTITAAWTKIRWPRLALCVVQSFGRCGRWLRPVAKGISPSVITVNVPTVLSFTGSGPGDRAVPRQFKFTKFITVDPIS